MDKKQNSSSLLNNNKNYIRVILRAFFVLFSLYLFLIIIPGMAVADSNNDGNAGLGWILFYITLVVLIIIIILWAISYWIMRGVILRLGAESDKIKRYEERKRVASDREYHEKDRDRRRKARSPKGNCIVCNRKFIPGSDAFQCECGKFIHVHCLTDLSLCPHCGREIDKDYGIVRLEETGDSRVARSQASRTKIRRLIKPKFCPVCNKIIKAGDSAMECDNCGAVFHPKCSDRAKVCPKCNQ